MTAVLIILFDSVCAQNLYIKSENQSGHCLTCLGGFPSHVTHMDSQICTLHMNNIYEVK